MKIYQFESGDMDCVAAYNKVQAINYYLEMSGMKKSDLNEYQITIISRLKAKSIEVVDFDIETKKGNYPIVGTLFDFLLQAEADGNPKLIASTCH